MYINANIALDDLKINMYKKHICQDKASCQIIRVRIDLRYFRTESQKSKLPKLKIQNFFYVISDEINFSFTTIILNLRSEEKSTYQNMELRIIFIYLSFIN